MSGSTPAKRERTEPSRDWHSVSPGSSLSLPSTPIIYERHDRYCCSCGGVIENAALENFPGQKCGRCNSTVEYRGTGDGLWKRCVRCDVFLRCTFKYCYICGRNNQHFAPGKVLAKEEELKAYHFQLFEKERKEEEFMASQAKELEQSQQSANSESSPTKS